MKKVTNEGFTLSDALAAVIRDPDLKEAYFTTPIALKAATSTEAPPNKWFRLNDKGNKGRWGQGGGSSWKGASKGSGKGGKGKDKGKNQDSRLAGLSLVWRTPDNRDLCFAWNAGTCEGKCNRVHQCRVKGCYADHPAIHHKEKTAA